MDGKNLKIPANILEKYFTQDKFGLFIPKPDALDMEGVERRMVRQLKADTGLAASMTGRYTQTDVVFTDNPEGNSPVLGFGIRDFGKRVYTRKKSDIYKMGLNSFASSDPKFTKRLEKRANAIRQYGTDVYQFVKGLEPTDDPKKKLIWQVEMDQSLTGGGFDNNAIGEVHKSGLHFVIESSKTLDLSDSALSSYVVEAALWLKDELVRHGFREGELEPDGASKVRFEQDNDGMLGWPVLASAYSPLTRQIADRLLIEFGVSTREFVGTTVTDRYSKNTYEYRVLDAVIHIMDNTVVGSDNWHALIILLARIQKHGWILDEDGRLVPKPGKTRSVYPVAALPAMQEAMTFSPFLNMLKERRVSFMPSLQNKEIRGEMIWKQITDAFSKDYDYLAADWSAYDATVKGSILATVIQLAVKPFYNARWHEWVDLATHTIVNKYVIFRSDLAELNSDDFSEARSNAQHVDINLRPIRGQENRWTVFGLQNGLPSGLKFTHGGGSMYGMAVIHYMIPKLLGYEPIVGSQAGDDTLLGIPKSYIDIDSDEKTYKPISEIASQLGLKMNPSKQIWHQSQGEVVKVFLQEIFHYQLDIRGVGSMARPLSALPTSEYDKGLSISEQMMAQIARMNGGSDNPFINQGVEFWFERESYLGSLFKEYGVSGFEMIIQTIGEDTEEIAKRIDVGSFTWGIGRDDLRRGTLPILPVMAEVAKDMAFSESPSKVLRTLGAEERRETEENVTPIEDDYFDILEEPTL